MLSDYRLISYHDPLSKNSYDLKPRIMPYANVGGYVFKNTVKLISINSSVVDKFLGIHNLSDYKLRKVKLGLEAIIPVDLEAICFKEVPSECISL